MGRGGDAGTRGRGDAETEAGFRESESENNPVTENSPPLRVSVSPCLRVSPEPPLRVSVSPCLRVSVSPCLRVSVSPPLLLTIGGQDPIGQFIWDFLEVVEIPIKEADPHCERSQLHNQILHFRLR